jgi:Derlin-2/3
MDGIKSFLMAIPPLTRTFTLGTFFLSLCMTYKILNPYVCLLYLPDAFTKLQLWRLVTTFFYAGPFSMSFPFSIMTTYYSCQSIEKYFGDAHADMLTMVLFNCFCCILFGWLADSYMVLQWPLMFSFMYVWSKKEPD